MLRAEGVLSNPAKQDAIMEKGIVKSYDKICATGMISRMSEVDVRFYTESVIGRNRAEIVPGDSVWFDIDNVKNLHIAINIRKV